MGPQNKHTRDINKSKHICMTFGEALRLAHAAGRGGGTDNLGRGHEHSPRNYIPAERSPITLSNMCVHTKIALYRTTVHVLGLHVFTN